MNEERETMKIDDGGPAYPHKMRPVHNHTMPDVRGLHEWPPDTQPGMSLRDWFAGQAMKDSLTPELEQMFLQSGRPSQDAADVIASRCGLIADAMILEKRRTEGEPGNPNEPYCPNCDYRRESLKRRTEG